FGGAKQGRICHGFGGGYSKQETLRSRRDGPPLWHGASMPRYSVSTVWRSIRVKAPSVQWYDLVWKAPTITATCALRGSILLTICMVAVIILLRLVGNVLGPTLLWVPIGMPRCSLLWLPGRGTVVMPNKAVLCGVRFVATSDMGDAGVG
ncbi:hypothetical protein LINGRAHAP2_LOCUS10199, partial [Linum grandiflorum]